MTFSLANWLDYFENCQQQDLQIGLARVRAVARKLGLLQFAATVITVAGTNGKGSTVGALESIYHTAGYRVATYTSPHLLAFNERIRMNLSPITDEQLCAAFLAIEQGRGDIPLTYFEVATLAALWTFKSRVLDVIIFEVGIGGRLDATNIVDPDLSIITTIDLDHQDYLGDTKEAIGYEKAGILRTNKPFIYADNNPPDSIMAAARALNTPLFCLGNQYNFTITDESLQFSYHGEMIAVYLPRINPQAAAAAIMASLCLKTSLNVSTTQLQAAMQSLAMLGRQQVVEDVVTTVFDVAHNPQAVSSLANFIERYPRKGLVRAVFSGLKDKDLCGLIRPMQAFVDCWYPAVLTSQRAAPETLLLAAFHSENQSVPVCFQNPALAYDAARKQANPGDLIVVYGSFLTVSAVMTTMTCYN